MRLGGEKIRSAWVVVLFKKVDWEVLMVTFEFLAIGRILAIEDAVGLG